MNICLPCLCCRLRAHGDIFGSGTKVSSAVPDFLERTNLDCFGIFLQEGTPGAGIGTPWLLFVSATKTSPIWFEKFALVLQRTNLDWFGKFL